MRKAAICLGYTGSAGGNGKVTVLGIQERNNRGNIPEVFKNAGKDSV